MQINYKENGSFPFLEDGACITQLQKHGIHEI